MAQEFRVGGNEVLLSLAPEYRLDASAGADASDVGALLGAIQRFKPFVDYLTAFKAPAECELTTVVIKNVGQIGQRISSVTCDVTLRHAKSNNSITQPVHLASDQVPAVVLPILEVAGGDQGKDMTSGKYAVLFPRARLALGSKTVLDAPFGYFDAASSSAGDKKSASAGPLNVTNGISAEDLAAAGFTAQHLTEKMCTPLSKEDMVAGYEGQVPVRIFACKRTCTVGDVERMLSTTADGDKKQPPFVLVPLEDVVSRTSDIHAVLAASLLI